MSESYSVVAKLQASGKEEFIQAFKEAEKSVADFNERAQKASEKMADVGKKMTLGLTVPLTALGVAGFKAAAEFETGMAGVRKTTDMTADELDEMGRSIRNMAKEIPISVTELTTLAETAGQLGIEKNNIVDFTRVMADLGVATNITGQEGATAMAQFANITRMAQKDFDRMGSSIVELGNNTATTERDVLNMATRLAAAGSQAKMSQADILGVSAALASLGLEAQAGGSAFSKVINAIQLAVDTNSESLKDYAKVAGMSAAEFSKAWGENAAGALATFVTGLGETEKHGKSTNEILDQLGITELRMGDALRRTSGASELFNKTLEMSNRAWEENNALTEEAAILAETTKSKLQIAKNGLNDAAIELGTHLLPIVTDAIGMFTDLISKFTELPPEVQQNIVKFGLLAAAAGPIISVASKLTTGIGKLAEGFTSLVGKIASGEGILSGLTTAGTVGLAIAGVTALVSVIAVLASSYESTTTQVYDLIKATKESAEAHKKVKSELAATSVQTKQLGERYLELSKKARLSNAEQEEMKWLSEDLVSIMPELNGYLDEETGLLKLGKEAWEEYFDAKNQFETEKANYERRKQLAIEHDDLLKKLTIAQREREEAVAKYGNSTALDAARILRQTQDNVNNLTAAIAENREAWAEAGGQTEDSARRTEWAIGMIEYAYSQAGNASKDSAKKQVDSNKEILRSYTQTADDVKTALDKQLRVNETYHDLLKEKVEDVYTAMGGFGFEAVRKTELTAAQLKENLENQIKDWNAWQKGLAEIQGKIPDVLFDELKRMGVGALPLLEDFLNMSEDELKGWADLFDLYAKTGVESVEDEIGKIPNVSIESLKEAQRGMMDEADNVKSTGRTLGEKVVEGFEAGSSGSAAAAQNFASSFIGTLKANELAAWQAGYSLGSAAERGQRAGLEIASPSKAAIRNAENFGGTFIDSILAMIKKASQAGEQFAGAVADATMLPNIIPFPSLKIPAAVPALATGSIAAGSEYAAGSGGITQNITINSPDPLTPSEVARQTKYASQQLAMEW